MPECQTLPDDMNLILSASRLPGSTSCRSIAGIFLYQSCHRQVVFDVTGSGVVTRFHLEVLFDAMLFEIHRRHEPLATQRTDVPFLHHVNLRLCVTI